jgi:FlaA1/EpsC-like NDP-sugar epimerase
MCYKFSQDGVDIITLTHIKNQNFYVIILTDFVLFFLAHLGAYAFRFEFQLTGQMENFFSVLPYLLMIKVVVFYGYGMYRGMWRYTGLSDMWRLVQAVGVSSLVLVFLMLFMNRFSGFSRGIFILDGILTFVLVGGMRVGIRTLYQFAGKDENGNRLPVLQKSGIPTLIIGAGDAGEKTLREIMDNPRLDYKVMGFVDDKRGKKGLMIHGVPVLGRVEQIPDLVARYEIHEILIAAPSATGEEMRRIVSTCDACGVRFKTLPGIGELIDGKVSVKALRDVNYQDLLGRSAVKLKEVQIRDYLHNQVVLVTGAGGSIGSELCRQIIRFNPKQIILMDVSEPSLYEVQMELKHRVGYLDYVMVLGAVQNELLVDRTFRKYRPHVVFHAAAYKHVPMLERNPWQAVWNNIRGAQVMMEKAVEFNAGRFILVSTDKAVRPTNVMGTSKRCCERLLHAHLDSRTRMMAVRFGNVVGSAGSVVPLFRRQIEAGGPVTVTHPEVTRYFMTIPEACQLILQAGALGAGGEVFILEMGTPVKITDMAMDLIRLSGKEPGLDIEVVYTGLRPGEKLYEELITEGENIVSTEHEDIMVLRANGCFDGYGDQDGYREWLMRHLDELYQIADTLDGCAIKAKLNEIVPEYVVQDAECVL